MASAKARYSKLWDRHIKAMEKAISLRSEMVELVAAAVGVDAEEVLGFEETKEVDWGYRWPDPDFEAAVEEVRSFMARSEGGAA